MGQQTQNETSDKDISNQPYQKDALSKSASNKRSQNEATGEGISNTHVQKIVPGVLYKSISNSHLRDKPSTSSKVVPKLLPSKEIFSRHYSQDIIRNPNRSQWTYANDRHQSSVISYRAAFPAHDIPSHDVFSPDDVSSYAYHPPHMQYGATHPSPLSRGQYLTALAKNHRN